MVWKISSLFQEAYSSTFYFVPGNQISFSLILSELIEIKLNPSYSEW